MLLSAGAEAGDGARLHFVDVGYGDAIVLQPAGTPACLIDGGTASHAASLLDYLSEQNIGSVSWMLITHGHKNHFGALGPIIDGLTPAHVYVGPDERGDEGYAELLEKAGQQQIDVDRVNEGDVLWCGAVSVTILYPDKEDLAGKGMNANSVVSLLRHEDVSVLLTSDIPPDIQDRLLERYDIIKEARIVQVPHHGGRLSENFIDIFEGRTFVVSTGENPWGLPEDDMAALQGRLLRTDQDGTVIIGLAAGSFTVTTKR